MLKMKGLNSHLWGRSIIILSFLILVSFIHCNGQGRAHQAVEVEIGAGGLISFDKLFFDRTTPGMSLYGELRYAFNGIPMDIGIGGSGQIFRRKIGEGEMCDFISKNIMLVSDYAFHQEYGYRLLAGLGVGVGLFDSTQNITHIGVNAYAERGDEEFPLCVMPRICCEIGRHFRTSLGYMMEDKANRNLFFRVGYIF